MVNTFLVDRSFVTSAWLLDRGRLNKQITEAHQVLNALRHLDILASLFGRIPWSQVVVEHPEYRDNTEIKKQWIQTIMSHCKPYQGFHYCAYTQQWTTLDKQNGPTIKPIELDADHSCVYYQVGMEYRVDVYHKEILIYQGIPVYSVLFPGDLYIGKGYKSHPAVALWLGYEPALIDYIDAHVMVWVERGGGGDKNTVRLRSSSNYVSQRPPWTYDESHFHIVRAQLLHREIERREIPWYIYQESFTSSWLWSTLSQDKSQLFLKSIEYYQTASLALIPELKSDSVKFDLYRYETVLRQTKNFKKERSVVNWYNTYDDVNLQSILSYGHCPNFSWV